jgi:5'(3')-deoxyribonucleotidase
MRLIFDMDGTLADFDGAGGVAQMENEGFFRGLAPFPNVVETLQTLTEIGYDIYILSACIDTEYCKREKLGWLAEYMPFIPKNNIILMNVGQNKATSFIRKTLSLITEDDILFDDYGKNLKDWYEAGGRPVKCGKVRKEERKFAQLIKFENITQVI